MLANVARTVMVAILSILTEASSNLKTPRTPSPSSQPSSTGGYFVTVAATSTSPPVSSQNSSSGEEEYGGTISIPSPTAAIFHELPTEGTAPPQITAAPEDSGALGPGGVFHKTAAEIQEKFRQTTYWSCNEFPLTTHCGWHEPILDTELQGAAGSRDGRVVAIQAGVVAGIVGGLVIGV